MYGSMGSTAVLTWIRPVGQKELVQKQVSSFTIFSQNQRPQRWKALPKQKKDSLPNGPKSMNLVGKNMKNNVLYVVFLGIFGRDFPAYSRYSTIHFCCRGRSHNQIHANSVGLMISPRYKNVREMTGKKTLKQKRVEVFGCCKSILFGATCSEARFIKLLKQMMKTCTRPGETNMTYPTGGKEHHLEKCRLVGDIVSWQEGTVLGPG